MLVLHLPCLYRNARQFLAILAALSAHDTLHTYSECEIEVCRGSLCQYCGIYLSNLPFHFLFSLRIRSLLISPHCRFQPAALLFDLYKILSFHIILSGCSIKSIYLVSKKVIMKYATVLVVLAAVVQAQYPSVDADNSIDTEVGPPDFYPPSSPSVHPLPPPGEYPPLSPPYNSQNPSISRASSSHTSLPVPSDVVTPPKSSDTFPTPISLLHPSDIPATSTPASSAPDTASLMAASTLSTKTYLVPVTEYSCTDTTSPTETGNIETITDTITSRYCSKCSKLFVTVYTTVYQDICPTGITSVTYTVTETCTGDKSEYTRPTGQPPGFTTTEKVCTVCEGKPTISITCPISVDTTTISLLTATTRQETKSAAASKDSAPSKGVVTATEIETTCTEASAQATSKGATSLPAAKPTSAITSASKPSHPSNFTASYTPTQQTTNGASGLRVAYSMTSLIGVFASLMFML
jgi:hypothetical protein